MRMLRGCPDCGAAWREPTARFCGRCGARLTEQSDTSARGMPRLSLRTPPRLARWVAGIIAAGLVVGALAWAASRPPRVQQIDVAVPAQTELQAPPDRRGELPRCVVDGLEQDCVTWQLDARTTSVQSRGKLLVIMRREGLVQAVNPTTGDIVWSTGTPIVEGELIPGDVSGRVIVMGNERVELLDAGSGHTLGSYAGWLGALSDDRFAVVSNYEATTGLPLGPTLLVDMVSGQADEWELEPSEHVVDLTGPILTLVAPHDSGPTDVRAYDDDGELLWSVARAAWRVVVGELIHTVVGEFDPTVPVTLQTLDPRTGDVLWARELGTEYLGGPGLVHGSLIVPEGGTVVSLDPATGEERWREPLPAAEGAFVHHVRLPGVVMLTAWTQLGSSHLTALDVDSGEHLWTGPSLDHEWWELSDFTDNGVFLSAGSEFSLHHFDGTVTRFELTGHLGAPASIVNLDPLVVSTGNRLYGIDADIALSGEPQPRGSE